jgi:hypothetical protein
MTNVNDNVRISDNIGVVAMSSSKQLSSIRTLSLPFFIQRVPELAPYPCMTDTESLKKLIFVKKKCPGFKGLRVRDY